MEAKKELCILIRKPNSHPSLTLILCTHRKEPASLNTFHSGLLRAPWQPKQIIRIFLLRAAAATPQGREGKLQRKSSVLSKQTEERKEKRVENVGIDYSSDFILTQPPNFHDNIVDFSHTELQLRRKLSVMVLQNRTLELTPINQNTPTNLYRAESTSLVWSCQLCQLAAERWPWRWPTPAETPL